MRDLFADLWLAYEDCNQHKRNKNSYIEFDEHAIENLYQLLDELINRTYEISPSTVFIVHSPKPREVFAADYRDRIVQHLLLHFIYPCIKKFFIDNSYSCIKGRGPEFGVDRLRRMISKATCNYTRPAWALKIDLKNNFGNIDRQLLKVKLIRYLDQYWTEDDIEVRDLCYYIINCILDNDVTKNCIILSPKEYWNELPAYKSLFNLESGMPIGDITSQVLNNFFLSFADKYAIKELGINYYARYVDDIYMVSENKEALVMARNKFAYYLQSELNLKVNYKKSFIQMVNGRVDFCGKIITRNKVMLREASCNRYIRDLSGEIYNNKIDINKINSIFGVIAKYNYSKVRYLFNIIDKLHPGMYKLIDKKLLEVDNIVVAA